MLHRFRANSPHFATCARPRVQSSSPLIGALRARPSSALAYLAPLASCPTRDVPPAPEDVLGERSVIGREASIRFSGVDRAPGFEGPTSTRSPCNPRNRASYCKPRISTFLFSLHLALDTPIPSSCIASRSDVWYSRVREPPQECWMDVLLEAPALHGRRWTHKEDDLNGSAPPSVKKPSLSESRTVPPCIRPQVSAPRSPSSTASS